MDKNQQKNVIVNRLKIYDSVNISMLRRLFKISKQECLEVLEELEQEKKITKKNDYEWVGNDKD